jgi:hypothetical protein
MSKLANRFRLWCWNWDWRTLDLRMARIARIA